MPPAFPRRLVVVLRAMLDALTTRMTRNARTTIHFGSDFSGCQWLVLPNIGVNCSHVEAKPAHVVGH